MGCKSSSPIFDDDDDLAEDQKEVLKRLPAKTAKAVKESFIASNQEAVIISEKGDGKYWTPLREVFRPIGVGFSGGFHAISGRIRDESWERPTQYGYIVEDLKEKAFDKDVAAEEMSFQTGVQSMASSVVSSAVSSASSAVSSAASAVASAVESFSRIPHPLTEAWDDDIAGGKTRSINDAENGSDKLKKSKPKKQKPPKRDFMGCVHADSAHLFPSRATNCIPRYGILSQAVVGHDFEADFQIMMKDTKPEDADVLQEKLIKVLQMACMSANKPIGIASLPMNRLNVPKAGHLSHFDNENRWLFIPIMTLDEVLKWKNGDEYEVMVIAGELNDSGRFTDAQTYQSLLAPDVLKKDNHNLLDEPEAQKATDLLSEVVKGLADMVNGRGKEGMLIPEMMGRKEGYLDLNEDYQRDLAETANVLKKGVVQIPHLTWSSTTKVVGVKMLKASRNIPDPLLLVIKSAINWMSQNGEAPLPACKTGSDRATSSVGTGGSQGNSRDDGWATPSTPKIPKVIQFEMPVVTP